MSLAQDNLNRALSSGHLTLQRLATGGQVVLSSMPTRTLSAMAWDLESIQAAIRIELNERADSTAPPQDWG